MKPIPPFKYCFDEEDSAFIAQGVHDLLQSGNFLTLGRNNEIFEDEFRQAHGARYAVAVSSGTAALEILLRAVEVAGRKVIMPSNTYGATAVSILHAGGVPVLAECGEDFSLDPGHVESLLRPDVAAVVVVHIGGAMSAALPRLLDVCGRHGIPLIEDAAHATGASLASRPAGTWGLGGAFSFFSTKVITCGEGGMIVTQDARVSDLARLLRNHAKRPNGGMDVIGYNWRLTEIQALVGIAQVRKLSKILEERRRVAEGYASRLRGVSHVSIVPVADDAAPNYYKLLVRLPAGLRDRVRSAMQDRFAVTLGGEVYAVPCHRQKAFAAYAEGTYPVTDTVCDGHICPPIFPGMSPAECDHVATALRTVLIEELHEWQHSGDVERDLVR